MGDVHVILYSHAERPVAEHDVLQSGSADGVVSAIGRCRAPVSPAQSARPHTQETGQCWWGQRLACMDKLFSVTDTCTDTVISIHIN